MEKIVQTAGKMQLGDFAPEFAHYNDDVLFGENWNNQDIDLKTRCIVTMVALMASGITDSSLVYHLENAKEHGVTRAEAAAITGISTMPTRAAARFWSVSQGAGIIRKKKKKRRNFIRGMWSISRPA